MTENSLLASLNDPSLFRGANLIGGEWISLDGAPSIVVTDPADGSVIGRVPSLDRSHAARAIAAAKAAQPAWRSLTAKQRAIILRRLFDLMMANQDDLARIMTAEQGKPFQESRGEIAYAASFIEWFAEEGKRIYGDTIPEPVAGRRIVVVKEPIGVFAAITPWNFPAAMITRKAGPGWAAGCTGVIRPADETPFSAIALAVLAERAGFPPGVCNVITGDGPLLGLEITESRDVAKLSFTGSTEVGAILLAQCAPTIKRTSMELGGNAPFIVFDDCDLDAAITGALASKYRNAGQTCVCVNRFLVQDGIYDAFATRLAEAVSHMPVGNGRNEQTQIGPLIDENAIAKVEAHIADVVERGGSVVAGGKRIDGPGHFFPPTVLTNVSRNARIFQEETFGPVAPLFRFHDEREAVEMANDTPFGLAAYFYTKDIGRVMRVSRALEYGIVGINEGIISTEVAPFGGMKASGHGREGSHYGIEDYLEIKYLCIGGVDT